MKRWAIIGSMLGAFIVALFINSNFELSLDRGLVDRRAAFTFGEKEMLELLAKVNAQRTWNIEASGSRYEISVHFTQAIGDDRIERNNDGCVDRLFLQTAAALCFDPTDMPLTGSVVVSELRDGGPREILHAENVRASIQVLGYDLLHANLSATLPNGHLVLECDVPGEFWLFAIEVNGSASADRVKYRLPN